MTTIHVEHVDDGTVLTTSDEGLSIRLALVLNEYDYVATHYHTDDAFAIQVTPKLTRAKLRKIIREQFNPEVINVDTCE